MVSNYVPILKAKKGEFDALSHLTEGDMKKITPWFDVSMLTDKDKKKLETKGELPIVYKLNSVANGIANVCSGHEVYIDLPQWPTNGQTEHGEHVISHMINRLDSLGVSVNPVIDFESWDDPVYSDVFKKIRLSKRQCICIRLSMNIDTVAEILTDPDYIKDHMESILKSLNVTHKQTALLIDFSDISSANKTVPDMIEQASKAIALLSQYKFNNMMMAGCSMPPFISSAVKSQNDVGIVIRKEMIAWQAILEDTPSLNLTFSDYCVRGPSSAEVGYGNTTNGKIRYSIDKNYFIARGYPLSTGLKGEQHYGLSEKIINSGYYMGRSFSWGDDRIHRCSEEEFKGNACNWIAIDTNHHMKTVLAEIYEFRQKVTIQQKSKEKA